jgi:hypothetical protein
MSDKKTEVVEDTEDKKTASKLPKKKKEIGGTDGPEPTRFWRLGEKGNYLRLLIVILKLLIKCRRLPILGSEF